MSLSAFAPAFTLPRSAIARWSDESSNSSTEVLDEFEPENLDNGFITITREDSRAEWNDMRLQNPEERAHGRHHRPAGVSRKWTLK